MTKRQKNTAQSATTSALVNPRYMLAGILILTFIVFANVLSNEFVEWDDDVYILTNNYIKDLSWHGIKTIFSVYYEGNYHPLTCFSNAVEYKLFGLNPKAYHFFNLVIHLLNVALVFRFIRLLSNNVNASAIVALFFAIHPMHVESVVWASERKDVLYAFFYLLSLIYYLKWKDGKGKYYKLSLVYFLCSLLSKSMAVTLPAVLIVIDYFKSPVDFQRSRISARYFLKHLPFFVLSVIFSIIAFFSQQVGTEAVPTYSFIDRIILASYGVAFYIIKSVLPVNMSAIILFPQKSGGMFPLQYYVAPLIFPAIIILIYKLKNYRKHLIFGLLFFLITISIVSQFFPFGKAIVAERYTYIPYLGLFFIVGKIYSNTIEKNSKTFLKYILFVIAIIFSIVSFQRVKIWKSSNTLFTDAIEKDNNCALAYNNRGNYKNSIKDYRGALSDYSEAIRSDKNYFNAYKNRGRVKYLMQDYSGAIEDYSTAIRLNPNVAATYYDRALSKEYLKDYTGSLTDLTEAIRLSPQYDEAYNNRGIVKAKMENYQGALEDFSEAIRINPKYTGAYTNRALVNSMLKLYKEACEDWYRAAQLGDENAKQKLQENCK